MTIQIRKATRRKSKLRIGLCGVSGSGKTYSALKLAMGLGKKIGLIDTEEGSGDLYSHLGDYDIIGISAPYTMQKYLDAIKAFEKEGYDVIVLDSISHAWAGDGGLLDKQGKIADSGKVNSFAAWRTVTPEHNSFISAMLNSKSHIIATMRSKTEYVLETNERGKQVPRKIGTSPVQRDGMEYEFTTVFDIDQNHIAHATKDRTSVFDGQYFKISEDTGAELIKWLDDAADPVQPLLSEDQIDEISNIINPMCVSEDVDKNHVKASMRDYLTNSGVASDQMGNAWKMIKPRLSSEAVLAIESK